MNKHIAKKVLRDFPYGFDFHLSDKVKARIRRAYRKLGLPTPELQTAYGGPESVIGQAVQQGIDKMVMERLEQQASLDPEELKRSYQEVAEKMLSEHPDVEVKLQKVLREPSPRLRGQTQDLIMLDDKIEFPKASLAELTVSELKARCKEQSLNGYSRLNKVDLIALLNGSTKR